jgi:hypothetical protein
MLKIMDKEWMIMMKKWIRDRKMKVTIWNKMIINNKIILMMKIILRMSLSTPMKMRKKKIQIYNKISWISNKWIKESVVISVSFYLNIHDYI